MLSLTLKSIRANKARFVLTGVAVLLGVAFMTGTFVLTDTIKKSYDNISGNVYSGTDAVVRSSRSIAASHQGPETRGTVDATALDTVRATDGVAAAEPDIRGIAVVVGHDGRLLDANRNRAAPIALAWHDTPALNPMRLVSGTAPRAPDDIVIDRDSATKGHFAVGEPVRVVGPAGSRDYRIAGVATYAGSSSAAGAQVVAFTPDTAAEVLGVEGRYSAIQIVGAPGISSKQLVANLSAALAGSQTEVVTGTQAAADARKAAGASFGFISVFLMTFAIVGLVVGAFVIHNTFSITVAQRSKETALLRAIGARRLQVLRSIRIEALITGLFASVAGALAGVGLAIGLRGVLVAFGMELPSGSVIIKPQALVISVVMGVVVTLVAVWAPARKASKVAPVQALRDAAAEPVTRSTRRVVAGAITTVAGIGLIAEGLSGAGAAPVALGAFCVFLGVAWLGPVLARRFVRVVGWPLSRMHGVAGRLARENAMRNPRRTAATSSALMVGIGLVAFITVFAASARASIATSVDRAMRTDFIITTQYGMGGLSPTVAERIDSLPETGVVTSLRYFDTKVRGAITSASAVDPARVAQGVTLHLRAGDFTQLGTSGVAVQEATAKHDHLGLGDTVTMSFPEAGDRQFTVVAIYGTKEPLGDYVISTQAFDDSMATHVDNDVVVSAAPGFSKAETRAAVQRVLRDFPTAELLTKSEFTGSMTREITKTLNLVYVLLAMALLIALFGIANTLALSVFERRRELGVLRAVGMARAQLRAAVRWESVLIALLGTSLGTVIGLGFGWSLVRALESQGFNTFAVPYGQLATIVVCTALAAVIAALHPARRAAKVDILTAINAA